MRVLMYCTFFACLLTLSTAVRHYFGETEVTRALQMLEDGMSQRRFAKRFGVSQSVILRLWTRFQETDTHKDPDKVVNA